MPRMGAPKTMLVLEDELLYLQLVVTCCEKVGLEVVGARTVDEALALLTELKTIDIATKTVDALWIDHFLPGKNGNEFVKEVLAHDEWKNIPMFLVSNAVEPDIVNWYLRAGIKQHFPKISVRPEQIVTDIDLYLQRHGTDVPSTPDTIHGQPST